MAAAGAVARRGWRPPLARAGVLAGLMAGLIGVGGGIIMVPAMVSARVGLSQRVAAGTSLAAIVPIAVVGALTYGGARQVDGFAAVCVIPGSVVGAIVGARLTRHIPNRTLAIVFALVSLGVAVRLVIPAGLAEGGQPVSATALHGVELTGAGVVAGVASGLLGIGGGVLIVPILTLGFGISQQLAQGTSLAAIVPTGLSGAVTHQRMGHLHRGAAAILGVFGVAGAFAGALLATHLPETPLRVAFALYLATVGVRIAAGTR
jgi:uncharacterized membrane protein YfcA